MSDVVHGKGVERPLVGLGLESVRPRWTELVRFLFVFGQLLLLALIIRQYQIESSAFLRLFLLAVAGFAIHYFAPKSWRMPIFVLLSLTAIVMILGPVAGVTLVAIGLVLIGICHLSIALRWRIVVLVGAGGLLALLRSQGTQLDWASAVWPILGSMFMFRLIVYVYDLQHDKTPPDFWSSLGYFFMLPNVCFPLFPVVDYKTFRRQYLDQGLFEISSQGVVWILRGLLHLVLYRIVYYYFALPADEVVDSDSLVQFLVSNFMLYLRISGHFHIIVGILYLFGFRLPETHHKYVLSSSFTEFWRRINIYWKDFMMKIVYLPVYFRFRSYGNTTALTVATTVVFIGTWAAHSYQWFWLRGSFPVIWQDLVFWGALALLVVVNSLVEIRYGRKRSLGAAWSVKDNILLGAKAVGTFLAIIILWSLWTSDSFAAWLSMWSFLGRPGGAGFPLYFIVLVIIIFGGALLFGRERKAADSRSRVLFEFADIKFNATGLRSLALLLALTMLGLPQFYTQLDASTANIVMTLRTDKLSRLDAAELQRGYYEDLTRVDRFNSKLWEVYMKKPIGWLDVTGTGLTRFTGDFAKTELIPSYRATTSFSIITTNRWGMRDQDYELDPQPGTYRIAMLGASSVMGWGVEDEQTFEAVLERMLNMSLTDDQWTRIESLNFGVPGYYPLQQRPTLDKAFRFKPHAVLYIATGRELSRAAYYLGQASLEGVAIPYPALQSIAEEADLASAEDQSDAVRRLEPYESRLLAWLYGEMVRECARRGVHPVLVFLPQVDGSEWQEETPETLAIARRSGFHVIDLSGVYDKHEGDLRIAEWDSHPDVDGHRLVAEELHRQVTRIWPEISQKLEPAQ